MIVALTSPAEAYCNSTIPACEAKLNQVDAVNASKENFLNALTDRVTLWNFELETNQPDPIQPDTTRQDTRRHETTRRQEV